MDIQWFEDVLALLEEGNMTSAAQRRNITQPAFSRRLRKFEEWLGTDVIKRGPNRVEISSALISNEKELRAIMMRIAELRTKVANHDASASSISIAAQHSALFSTFPDMALRARFAIPQVTFRMRAGNLNDCVTMFLRGDADMLLCYEAHNTDPLRFGEGVARSFCGRDYLVPVVGGALRYAVRDDRDIPQETPAIVYPGNSYFGEVLHKAERRFATPDYSANPVCQSAFSSGIREMVLSGVGVGWLPYSMAHREIESGDLVSLGDRFGKEPLDVAVYANQDEPLAMRLAELWMKEAPSAMERG